MKKAMFCLLFIALIIFAMPISAQSKFYKITIEKAQIWPVKANGKCWDAYIRTLKLPKRGEKTFKEYMKEESFKKATMGMKAPDCYVTIKIGKNPIYSSPVVKNTCSPKFKVSHIFRVGPKDQFSLRVYDNDGRFKKFNKSDIVGKFSCKFNRKFAGGVIRLGRFGQVEDLVLKIEEVRNPDFLGLYRVGIKYVEVRTKKSNGKNWDAGWGSMKKPDLKVVVRIGNVAISTKVKKNTFSTKFGTVKSMVLKKGMKVYISVFDQDIGKVDVIGKYQVDDVSKMINSRGKYKLSFQQVKELILTFEKK